MNATWNMEQIRAYAERIANYPTTVLIEGETGTGKEVMSSFIHQCSIRRGMPFIKINCGAIPEGLIESELFGYERGAFTGAKREGNPGLFELADKGTLLLDEIGELSHAMQVKVLRVLQEREVRRVGGSWSRSVDVRILASTNQSLMDLVERGSFRKDLYYRLNIGYIKLPPLRERWSEIEPMAKSFLDHYNKEFSLNRWFNPEVIHALQSYAFPGNIRELRNIIEIACITSEQDEITAKALPGYMQGQMADGGNSGLEAAVERFETQEIRKALRNTKSIRRAAALLKISNATLLRKMKRYGIEKLPEEES